MFVTVFPGFFSSTSEAYSWRSGSGGLPNNGVPS
jgi:hypothetical protein